MPKPPLQMTVLRWVLLCVALNAVGQMLFKAAQSWQLDESIFSLFYHVEIWAAFMIYALSAACWLWILSRVQLSLAYPFLSLTFPIVVALGAIFFSEEITPVRWAGVGMIVIGVSLLPRT